MMRMTRVPLVVVASWPRSCLRSNNDRNNIQIILAVVIENGQGVTTQGTTNPMPRRKMMYGTVLDLPSGMEKIELYSTLKKNEWHI